VDADDLVVERVADPARLDAAEWDDVVAKAGAPVFCSYAFVSAYHRAPLLPVDGAVHLVVRRRSDGGAVAVVAAYFQRHPDPIGSLAAAYPEASGPALLTPSWHCYDGEPAAAVAPDGILPVLLTALRDAATEMGAAWYGMLNVAPDGETGTAIRRAGLPLRHLVDRYRMDLTGLDTIEDYLRRLSHNNRHSVRRHLRRAADAGVEATVLPVAAARLDEIAELSGRTAARFSNTSFYRPETFPAFVRALGDAAGAIEVRERGRLVSAVVYLRDARRFHAWTGGVDYEVGGAYSAYRVMHAALVARAIELRVPVLEGGRSNGDFKSAHGMSPLPLAGMLLPV